MDVPLTVAQAIEGRDAMAKDLYVNREEEIRESLCATCCVLCAVCRLQFVCVRCVVCYMCCGVQCVVWRDVCCDNVPSVLLETY
jgi:hypothetical protein